MVQDVSRQAVIVWTLDDHEGFSARLVLALDFIDDTFKAFGVFAT
jgi:hypothetical protein